MASRRTEQVVWVPSHGIYVHLNRDEQNERLWHVRMMGRLIGTVWRGTRTYSPPTHRGSRIVKYHKQVPCWYARRPAMLSRSSTFNTRRGALGYLIYREKEEGNADGDV